MVYVKRKDRETTASLIRRFSRRIQASGVLLQARRTRFFESRTTRCEQRVRALRRLAASKERERLAKLGRLKKLER